MLVYLDSAHFALLERIPKADTKEFWAAWHACGCELALSLHHLQEIGQLSNRTSAERRLQVLEPFPIVRCRQSGSDDVMSLEIQYQLHKLAGREFDIQRTALDRFFSVVTVSELDGSLAVQPVIHQVRDALELGTEGANLAKEAARQGQTLDPNAPVDLAKVTSAEMKAAMEAAMENLPPAAAELMRQMIEQVHSAIVQEGTVGGALKAIYGLKEITKHRAIPDSDLARVSIFYRNASAEAVLVGVQSDHVQELVSQIDPYQAPGFALQLAVDRARTLHPKRDEPGDQIDVAHLAFAPYVDIAFADKRTLGFITQEARDRPQLLAPKFTRNIARAGTLDRVAEVIAEHHRAIEGAAS